MSIGSRRGFTLIEVLVSVTLLGVGVASVLGAMGSLNQAEARNRDAEKMYRLAQSKLDELAVTGQLSSSQQDGDFSEQNEPNYAWQVEVDPSGVDSLDAITVIVTRRDAPLNWPEAKIDTLRYLPAATGAATP